MQEMECGNLEDLEAFKLIRLTEERLEVEVCTAAGVTQRESSPFYQHFKLRREDIALTYLVNTKDPDNPYYNPTILNVFQNTYIAYFPFFASTILLTRIEDSSEPQMQ